LVFLALDIARWLKPNGLDCAVATALKATVSAMSSAGFNATHFQTAMLFIFIHYFQFYHLFPHCL
jgi:hypothetical protein